MSRILNMLGRAIIGMVNDAGARQSLQVEATKGEVIDGVPRFQNYGISSVPPAGSDAILVFLGGDREQGAAVAAEHMPSRPQGLAEGDACLYDNRGSLVKLEQGQLTVSHAQSIVLQVGSVSIALTPAGVAITSPQLTHNGVNVGATHLHGGVTVGQATTGVPS